MYKNWKAQWTVPTNIGFDAAPRCILPTLITMTAKSAISPYGDVEYRFVGKKIAGVASEKTDAAKTDIVKINTANTDAANTDAANTDVENADAENADVKNAKISTILKSSWQKERTLTISPVDVDSEYEFTVQVRDRFGNISDFSEPMRVKTETSAFV